MVRFLHGTIINATRQTQNRDIVASLFQMVAILFQHYNMCCAQFVVANRIV